MDILSLLYIAVGILLPLWFFTKQDPKKKYIAECVNKIPGPLRLPIVGTTWKAIGLKREDIWKKIEEITKEYWPIFRTWLAFIPEVHILEPEHIEPILRSSVNINKGFVYKFLHQWLGTGLLTSTGQKWFAHRKLITPTFHFKILEHFQEVFAEKSQVLVQKLEREADKGAAFDVYPYITHCALDIICETAMGSEINAQNDSHSSYVAAIYDMSELIVRRLLRPWLHIDWVYALTKEGKRTKECIHILHTFTNTVINERRMKLKERKTENVQSDSDELGRKRRVAFLDLLLEAQAGGAALSDEDIREEVDTFMFEGHDTTSAGMCWVTFLLGNHPEIQERVFEEQKSIFGDSDRLPTSKDLAEMKYLEQVIKESLRLYPSVPIIFRSLTEEVKAGEYTLPEGVQVALHIYHTHRNPKHFPEPEKFDPDRFLPERIQGRHPYAYVPFSAGSRNCIGQKFALMEEKTVLSSLFRKYRVRSLMRPSEITLMGELVLRPANGVQIVIEKR